MTAKAVNSTSAELEVSITRYENARAVHRETDLLAVEEPLEIRLGFLENGRRIHRPVSITMRTPGNDFELATGFLFTEGILSSPEQIDSIKHCGKFPSRENTIRIEIASNIQIDAAIFRRNFYTTSSCGVCGKSSLEALSAAGAGAVSDSVSLRFSVSLIHSLPASLRAAQDIFEQTGGLHAAGLFDASGQLTALREDVGRHNAVDKLIGAQFLAGRMPLTDRALFLSGRASFELIQKAAMAGIPIVAAVGAPSSLAVAAARQFNITLIGFVRDERFNVYTGVERITNEAETKE
jgi:FdhD protein